jgi:prophage regulatory protein
MTKHPHDTPALPAQGFLRLPQVLAVFPVSKTSWYRGVDSGAYPQPVQLSPRTVAWRVEDIRALIDRTGGKAA